MKLLKLFLILMLFGIPRMSWGANSVSQTLTTVIVPVANINALQAVVSTSIDPETGNLSSILESVFNVKTNIENVLLDLNATVSIDGAGEKNAIFLAGVYPYIILANANNRPSLDTYTKIITNTVGAITPNAITYAFEGNSPQQSSNYFVDNNDGTKKMRIKVDNQSDFTVESRAKQYAKHYEIVADSPGDYQAQVTLTLVSP